MRSLASAPASLHSATRGSGRGKYTTSLWFNPIWLPSGPTSNAGGGCTPSTLPSALRKNGSLTIHSRGRPAVSHVIKFTSPCPLRLPSSAYAMPGRSGTCNGAPPAALISSSSSPRKPANAPLANSTMLGRMACRFGSYVTGGTSGSCRNPRMSAIVSWSTMSSTASCPPPTPTGNPVFTSSINSCPNAGAAIACSCARVSGVPSTCCGVPGNNPIGSPAALSNTTCGGGTTPSCLLSGP